MSTFTSIDTALEVRYKSPASCLVRLACTPHALARTLLAGQCENGHFPRISAHATLIRQQGSGCFEHSRAVALDATSAHIRTMCSSACVAGRVLLGEGVGRDPNGNSSSVVTAAHCINSHHQSLMPPVCITRLPIRAPACALAQVVRTCVPAFKTSTHTRVHKHTYSRTRLLLWSLHQRNACTQVRAHAGGRPDGGSGALAGMDSRRHYGFQLLPPVAIPAQ